MNKRIFSGKSRNLKRKMKEKSGSNKYGLFAVPLAIAISIVMISVVFVGQNNDVGDDDPYPVLNAGTTGPSYTYGDLIIGVNGEYCLAYSELSDGTYSVEGWDLRYNEPSGELTIPSSVKVHGEDKDVTRIGVRAFEGCTGITSVNIEEGVKDIHYFSFKGCTELISVDIPESASQIFMGAFAECTKLGSVTTGNGVTRIDYEAFSGCTELGSVNIGKKVSTIANDAFSGCTGLTSFSVDSANTVYSSSDGALYQKSPYKLIKYPAGKTDLHFSVHKDAIQIGDSAFSDCINLTSVTLEGYISYVDDCAFNGCTGLTFIDVNTINSNFSQIDGVLYNREKTTLVRYPEGKSESSFTIPESVISVNDSAFRNCTGLNRVSIPEGIESIGEDAFNGCTELKSIVFRGAAGDNVLFGNRSFFLGSETESVTCTVYSQTDEGFLSPFKNSYTEFIYKSNLHQVTFEMNGHGTQIEIRSVSHEDSVTEPSEPSATTYTFAGWFTDSDLIGTAYDFNEPVTDDITLYAKWVPKIFTVVFKSGDTVFDTQDLGYGTEITAPSGTPSKDPTGDYVFEFTGWDGYSAGITVPGDIEFTATFKAVLEMSKSKIAASVTEDIIELDLNGQDWAEISEGTFENILDAMADSADIKGVTLLVPNGSVHLNRTAVESLRDAGPISVSISELNADELNDTVKDKIGDRPIYNIGIGNTSTFGNDGKLTISLEYELKEGENPDNLIIWFIDDEGKVEKFACTYSEGYVTFVTDHLSYYSIMYSEPGSGGSPIIYAAIAIIALAAVSVAVIFLKKKGIINI